MDVVGYAKIEHYGDIVECRIETMYNDNTCRISIREYDYRGRYTGEYCSTVSMNELIEIQLKGE